MNLLRTFSLGGLLVGFAVAVFACADHDGSVANGAQDLSASAAVCGGATCGAGLRCCNDKCQPAGLACSALSDEGAVCGSDVATQKECAAGLTCVLAAGAPISEHTKGTCQKPLVLGGEWGADDAILTFDQGKGRIQFGCAVASIDSVSQTGPTTFTATGTHTSEAGAQPPPGQGADSVPATFSGTLSENSLTLEMTVAGDVSKLTFTKDRQISLIFCE
jgi:hypothetical protein